MHAGRTVLKLLTEFMTGIHIMRITIYILSGLMNNRHTPYDLCYNIKYKYRTEWMTGIRQRTVPCLITEDMEKEGL